MQFQTRSPRWSFDRYDLYELCVQDAAAMARFLQAVHGGDPRVMREDFCGGGAVAREWAGLGRGFRAIAVDQDAEPLARLKRTAAAAGVPRRVRCVHADVMDCSLRADVISATNFPIGYWHTRPELVRYLSATRRRLGPGGVFVCDTYGGASAFRRMKTRRMVAVGGVGAVGGLRIEYTWEQREARARTRRVIDALHFRVTRRGRVIAELRDAFVYDWRLWSIEELRGAMEEAGFASVEIYDRLAEAVDHQGRVYVRPAEELGRDWVVYLVARKG
jgi:SAM-dependent methyltransferase